MPGYDSAPLVRSKRIWHYAASEVATTKQTIWRRDPDSLNLITTTVKTSLNYLACSLSKIHETKMFITKVNTLVIPTDLLHAIMFRIYTISHFRKYKTWFELHCLWLVRDWWRAKNSICLMTYGTHLAHQMSSNTLSSFRIKCVRMNMISGSTMIFLNFLWRDHKNVTCTLVSDSAGTNHSLGLHSASRVKCTKVEWCRAANLEEQTAKECGIWLRRSYCNSLNTIALSLSTWQISMHRICFVTPGVMTWQTRAVTKPSSLLYFVHTLVTGGF